MLLGRNESQTMAASPSQLAGVSSNSERSSNDLISRRFSKNDVGVKFLKSATTRFFLLSPSNHSFGSALSSFSKFRWRPSSRYASNFLRECSLKRVKNFSLRFFLISG